MTKRPALARAFARELNPAVLPKSIAGGVLGFLLQIILVLSFAALLFAGPLTPVLPYGIALLVAGDAVLAAVVALLSSFGGATAAQQDAPTAILAVAFVSVLSRLPPTANLTQQFATVVVMSVLVTIGSGLFFIVLGKLRMGRLVRFLPYPVMGGFLAGTGYLLVMGGIGVMLNAVPSLQMFAPGQLLRWVPGLMLGGIMLLVVERVKNPLALPALFALALGAFYLIAAFSNLDLARLSAEGWLLGPFPVGGAWQFPLSPHMLEHVDWQVLVRTPQLALVPLVGVVALLLNISGLELVIRRDLDLNRELIAAGVANLAGAFVGGATGYPAVSLSKLSRTTAGDARLPGVLIGALLGAVALANPSLFGYLPRMVLAGLLIFLGLGLLLEWVYRAWFRFPLVDFVILLAILVVIAATDFMWGIGVGLALAVVLFLVSYSRIPAARYAVSGKTFRSRVRRSPQAQEILDARGEELYVLKLHGFIFFGTADGLFGQIQARARRADMAPLRFIVLDLTQVTGLDSTALLSLEKLVRLTQEQQIVLALAGLHGRTRAQFGQGDLVPAPGALEYFDDLDHALEWCENRILAEHATPQLPLVSLQEQWARIVPATADTQKLLDYMERREVARGEILIRQGDAADALYFLEAGQLTAQLEGAERTPLRLEALSGGLTVGEIGFYLNLPRTATVVATEPSVVYVLTRAQLVELEKSDPAAAALLHRIVVQLLSDRVRHLTAVVNVLES